MRGNRIHIYIYIHELDLQSVFYPTFIKWGPIHDDSRGFEEYVLFLGRVGRNHLCCAFNYDLQYQNQNPRLDV